MNRTETKSEVIAVVGGKWGDEGKGKVVDILSGTSKEVIRAQGGGNAGHTVVNGEGSFALHLVPAGIFHPDVDCVIGPGVVVAPDNLISEMGGLQKRGVSTNRLFLSPRGELVLPSHQILDKVQDYRRGKGKIGTTGQGIGPAYEDCAGRRGVLMMDLLDRETFLSKVNPLLKEHNGRIGHLTVDESRELKIDYAHLEADYYAKSYSDWFNTLSPHIQDTDQLTQKHLAAGSRILLEGAQGTMLDKKWGTAPFVTSSSTTVAGLLNGAGIAPGSYVKPIGVFKAYDTRVGEGPLVTEMEEPLASEIRERGGEYGATTGRPRRVGWFDGVVGRYSHQRNGFYGLFVNMADVLSEVDPIKMAVAYELDGERIDYMPYKLQDLRRSQPVYKEHPGYKGDLSGVRSVMDLPENCVSYFRAIEDGVGAPILALGVGKKREDLVVFPQGKSLF